MACTGAEKLLIQTSPPPLFELLIRPPLVPVFESKTLFLPCRIGQVAHIDTEKLLIQTSSP